MCCLYLFFSKNFFLESVIDKESDLLELLCLCVDLIVDILEMFVYELVEMLCIWLLGKCECELMMVFEFFGFKYGILIDVDYVFDVCFLFNLYWDLKLCFMIGFDKLVVVFFD